MPLLLPPNLHSLFSPLVASGARALALDLIGVVICPNPTGSTSYGQDFTDAIQGQWGGLPYEDLVLGFEYIKHNLSYVDTARAVALG